MRLLIERLRNYSTIQVRVNENYSSNEIELGWQSLYTQSYDFSGSHIWMWELDHKEGWELKNWCFRTVVLEKTLQSPLDIKEIKAVNPKGDQSWISIGKTDAEAEALIPQPSDAMSRLIGKDPTHWKRPWCWERLKARGEGVDKGPDGWMASPTQWTGVRANFETWWRTGKPRLLWSMGSQTDTTERLNNNNEIEQMQNNFRDKLSKLDIISNGKKTIKN